MKLCMVGAGYVGLVSGAGFAEIGNEVICADVDRAKIAMLREGRMPIVEPGLEALVLRNVKAGRLSFTDDLASAITGSDLVFIAVGTPGRADGSPDISAVESVAALIKEKASTEKVLVLKSTVPPGTNRHIQSIVARSAHPIHIVSNPEFLKEGDAIEDFLAPDRIIIGCDPNAHSARQVMNELYRPLCREKERIIWMDPISAELAKYAGNALLAMRISFMNELALLSDRLGANIHDIRLGVGSDHRIGNKFLYAGAGYGGSCFPKDIRALIRSGHRHGLKMELARATEAVNERQKQVLFDKVSHALGGELQGKSIAIWGIAFKPKTDDTREAPSIALIDKLTAAGAKVIAHDPAASAHSLARFEGRARLAAHPYEAAEGADALVLVTEWSDYRSPDFEALGDIMRRKVIIDGRNIWANRGLRELGFLYTGVGVRG